MAPQQPSDSANERCPPQALYREEALRACHSKTRSGAHILDQPLRVEELLSRISSLDWRHAIYLATEHNLLALGSDCVVAESDEETDVRLAAAGLKYFIGVHEVQSHFELHERQ